MTVARAPRTAALLTALLGTAALLAGCGGGAASDDQEREASAQPRTTADSSAPDLSAPTTDTVQVLDPVAEAFFVNVPVGWDSAAYLSTEGDVSNFVTTSVSPDGRTVLFVGDPKMPQYWSPDQASEITYNFAEFLELMEVVAYTPADTYFPQYTADKFGQLPGFAITGVEADAERVAAMQAAFAAAGLGTPEAHAVDVMFEYSMDDGTPMQGLVQGMTINGGAFWQASVQGLATDRTVAEYQPMLEAMSASVTTNPDYTARQQAQHEANMADIQAEIQAMTARHQANMAWIQRSAQAHQQRMQSIWAANDASMANFYDRMDSMDRVQQGFINYINEENTVAPMGSGPDASTTWQVDAGYDRYWVNPDTGEYLGGDVNFGESQIRELGLNPGDYSEVTVIR